MSRQTTLALHTHICRHKQTEKQTDTHIDRQTDRETYPPCSKKVCTQSLLCRSQTFTVLSSLPDTIRRPSGENLPAYRHTQSQIDNVTCTYTDTHHCRTLSDNRQVTRSSAIAEGPRDASCQLKSCQLPRSSAVRQVLNKSKL